MRSDDVRKLAELNLLTGDQQKNIEEHLGKDLFSLKSVLVFLSSAGVLLTGTGAGMLAYKHSGSLAPLLIASLIAAAAIGLYYYCFSKAASWSGDKTESPGPMFDNLLLLGSILTGVFFSFLQIQYTFFGSNWIASLIPAVLFLASAYRFDHKGVLAMGLSSLCATIGFTFSATAIIHDGFDGFTPNIAWAALLVSLCITGFSWLLKEKRIKAHFFEVYQSFGLHLFCLALLFLRQDWPALEMLLLAGIAYFMGLSSKLLSKQLLVFSTVYLFIGLTGLSVRLLKHILDSETLVYLSPLYIIAFIGLLIAQLKKFKRLENARLQ